jgi:hypothetical protein
MFSSNHFTATDSVLYPDSEWTILGVFEYIFQTHHYLAIKFTKDGKNPIDGLSLGLRSLYQAKTIHRIVNNAEQEEATVAVPGGSLVDLVKSEIAKLGPNATNGQVQKALNEVLPGKRVRFIEDCPYIDAFHKVKTWFRYDIIDLA